MIEKELYEKICKTNFSWNYLALQGNEDALTVMIDVAILAWIDSDHARNKKASRVYRDIENALTRSSIFTKSAFEKAFPDDKIYKKKVKIDSLFVTPK